MTGKWDEIQAGNWTWFELALLLFNRRRRRWHEYETRLIVQWEKKNSPFQHIVSVFLLFCTSKTDVYLLRISSALFSCYSVLAPFYSESLLAGHINSFNRRRVGKRPRGICLRKNWLYYYYYYYYYYRHYYYHYHYRYRYYYYYFIVVFYYCYYLILLNNNLSQL